MNNDLYIKAKATGTVIENYCVDRFARLNSDGSLDKWGITNPVISSIIKKIEGNVLKCGFGFNNNILTIAIQQDGKILLGGEFTTYQGVSARYIIRLNVDGSRDTSFVIGTGFISKVTSIIIQSDGKILLGGDFTSYQGVPANRIIRLNADGSRDTSFVIGAGFNIQTSSIAIDANGKILIVGYFTTYQGVSVNRIIRLNADGSRDTSFVMGAGFNNNVLVAAIDLNGKIVVGGVFTNYQGVSAIFFIRLNADGSRDTSFVMGTGFDNIVNSIVIQSDGKILLGGNFTTYQGVSATKIIRLNADGSRDTSFVIGTGFNGQTTSIAIDANAKILIVGNFPVYQGVSASRIIRLNADGSRDTSFVMGTGFDLQTSSIAIDANGKIVVGGAFQTYNNF